jgi:seryl-tRNA synthetase
MKDPAERQAKIEAMRASATASPPWTRPACARSKPSWTPWRASPISPTAHPYGKDDSENVVIDQVGESPKFDFEPKPHWELGPALGIIDFERGVKITGSRFYVLSGAGRACSAP